MARDDRGEEKRPAWAKAIAPAAGPIKAPALEVKRDHSAGYDGKYAPRRTGC